jgi:signal transduction histidine kinase
MNLLTNAIQSLPPIGGKICITSKTLIDSENDGSTTHKVMISIRDNGRGIPREIMEHIFEPFFTTKKEGEGTGLGLAIILSLVKSMGGEIKVRSAQRKGSEFTIIVPVTFVPKIQVAA